MIRYDSENSNYYIGLIIRLQFRDTPREKYTITRIRIYNFFF